MSDEDFSKYPQSIKEVRANKSEDAADWSPRDAIIVMLRRIDAGEFNEVDTAIVAIRSKPKDGSPGHITSYSSAGPSAAVTFGTFELAKLKMYRDG
jgi:hypothetical protein